MWICFKIKVFCNFVPENVLDLFPIYEYNRYDVFSVQFYSFRTAVFLVVKQKTSVLKLINHLIFYIYGWEKEVPRYENDISAKEKIQI